MIIVTLAYVYLEDSTFLNAAPFGDRFGEVGGSFAECGVCGDVYRNSDYFYCKRLNSLPYQYGCFNIS